MTRLGAYRMIIGWYGYLTLLDFGLGGALSPLLARALGQGDTQALRGTLATGIRAYLRLTLVILVRGAGHDAADRVAGRGAIVAGGPPRGLGDRLRLAWMVSLLSFLPLGLAPFRYVRRGPSARLLGERADDGAVPADHRTFAFVRVGWLGHHGAGLGVHARDHDVLLDAGVGRSAARSWAC